MAYFKKEYIFCITSEYSTVYTTKHNTKRLTEVSVRGSGLIPHAINIQINIPPAEKDDRKSGVSFYIFRGSIHSPWLGG